VIASADVVYGDKITYVGAAPASAPHQLPPPPADFTGREQDLAILRSALSGKGAAGSLILRGMGGVGKTTLALKLAEDLLPDYPDAQIYLDLKGVDSHPLTPVQAMTHVLRSFDPEVRVPEGEAELAGRYHSVLHGKRVLLLMDNAAGKEQVEPLLPPSGSLLLVTSRFHFVLSGSTELELDELTESDARDLLTRIAPRLQTAEADEIARLGGRLPLALRLAGSALSERPDLSPAEYIRRFREGKERFGRVEASLDLSYELLDEEQRRLWRILTVFPGPFHAMAAAAVWDLDLDLDLARDRLGELTRSSLVDWMEKEERYRLHDLARQFARGRIQDSERDTAERRHARHFLEFLRVIDSLFKKGGQESLLALGLFDAEWTNIRAGQAWAAARLQEDDEAATLCDAYPDAAAYYLPIRRPPQDRIRWIEAGLAASRKLGNRAAEAHHIGNLGLAYASLGDARRAIEYQEQSLAVNREIGDREGEGAALGNLGGAYEALGEPQRAIPYHEQNVAIARETGDRRAEGNALGNLGSAYASLGENRRAIEYHEQNLAIAREIGDRHGEGNALGNLGGAYMGLGETRRAIGLYEQNLAIAREVRDRQSESIALGNLGLIHATLGEMRQAIDFYQQQLVIARDIGDRRAEGLGVGNLGTAYMSLGETQRAADLFERQFAIARERGDRRGEGQASWNLGILCQKRGEFARAAELMQGYVDYLEEIGYPDAGKLAAYPESLRKVARSKILTLLFRALIPLGTLLQRGRLLVRG
jgi:tetratricopeptide (TPR) repeat protein